MESKRKLILVGSILLVAVLLLSNDHIRVSLFRSKASVVSGPDTAILYGQDLGISENIDFKNLDASLARQILETVNDGYGKSWNYSQLEYQPPRLPALSPTRGNIYYQQILAGLKSNIKAPVENGFVSMRIGKFGASRDVLIDSFIPGIKPQDPELTPSDAIKKVIPPIEGRLETPELVYHLSKKYLDLLPIRTPTIYETPIIEPAVLGEEDVTITPEVTAEATPEIIPEATPEMTPTEIPVPTEEVSIPTEAPGAPPVVTPTSTPEDTPTLTPTPPPCRFGPCAPRKAPYVPFWEAYRLAYKINVVDYEVPHLFGDAPGAPTSSGGGGRGRAKGLTYSGSASCTADSECSIAGSLCIANVCQAPGMEGTTCNADQTNHDCQTGLVCNSSTKTCKQPLVLDACLKDSDCGVGIKTSNRYCGSDQVCHVKESIKPQIVFGTGNGLMGRYYCQKPPTYYATFRTSEHKFDRVDKQVNFNWGLTSPVDSYCPENGKNYFLVDWKGKIEIPTADTYTIYFNVNPVDDSGFFNFDGYGQKQVNLTTGEAKLTATLKQQFYDIEALMADDKELWPNNAKGILSWSTPTMAKQVIPQKYLYTYDALPPVITQDPPNITAYVGQDVTFTEFADGAGPMTFQWYKNGNPISGATSAWYTRTNVQLNFSADYTVKVSNAFGSVMSKPGTLVVNPIPGGNGTGLMGFYFPNPSLDGDPLLVRTDEQINFDWGTGAPPFPPACPKCAAGKPVDHFTARWYGQVFAPIAGNYSFKIDADDGVRLWIDDEIAIDNWYIPYKGSLYSPSLNLSEGKHNIRLEYWEKDTDANIKLYWSTPFNKDVLVPKEDLFPIDYRTPLPNSKIGDTMYIDAVTGEILETIHHDQE